MIIVQILAFLLGILLIIMGIDMVKERFLGGVIDVILAIILWMLAVVCIMLAFVSHPVITEGEIIEIGHKERYCRTSYRRINNITMPHTSCTPAHDYIIIEDIEKDKQQKIKVKDKDQYSIGDYYKEEE